MGPIYVPAEQKELVAAQVVREARKLSEVKARSLAEKSVKPANYLVRNPLKNDAGWRKSGIHALFTPRTAPSSHALVLGRRRLAGIS
jgi:hypothetical protein